MLNQLFYYATLISVVFKTAESACIGKSNTAIITALLPLHSGNDCSIVELRALQQAAALQATINSLNPDVKRETNIVINLKIQDTCSSEDGAVKAALKSMVDSDLTCLHSPLFMGFIGPEDKKILEAVHQVTKLFNATHIVPYNFEASTETNDEAPLHVISKQSHSQAQSIITVLRQLKWTTFSLAVDDSAANQALAKNILELLQSDQSLCIIDNIVPITDSISINKALVGINGYGIVVLSDSARLAADVIQANKHLSTPMIIFINKIGLQSWQIPTFNSTLVILQQTLSEHIDGLAESINASLHSSYIKQQDQLLKETSCKDATDVSSCIKNMGQDAFQGSIDASLLPISYAARLIASGLSLAHKDKCRVAGAQAPVLGLCSKLSHLSQGDWHNILRSSTAFVKQNQIGNLPAKINFKMEVTNKLDIFIRNQINLGLEKIGQITDGIKLQLYNGHSFSSVSDDYLKVKIKMCPNNGNLQTLPTSWAPIPKATPGVLLEPVEGNPEDEFYDTVTLLCGAGFGIVVFFIIMIYIVYSSFKVKTEKESTGGTPPIQRKPSRIARWRRGSGQSSRASIRTIN